jgi:hypothetical protein
VTAKDVPALRGGSLLMPNVFLREGPGMKEGTRPKVVPLKDLLRKGRWPPEKIAFL